MFRTLRSGAHSWSRSFSTTSAPPLRSSRLPLIVATSAAAVALGTVSHTRRPVLHLDNADDDDKTQYFATTGRKRDPSKPIFSRDDVTVVCLIGGPQAGKSEQAKRIAERFDFLVEATDSDHYSDIALNLPTAHLSSPAGVGKLRVLIDSPFEGSQDPLKDLEWFEKTIAPICVLIFVDCPAQDASKRAKGADLKADYKAWEEKWMPVVKKYRYQGNIMEMTGQWPADELWEQVEAKLESALELEERGEL